MTRTRAAVFIALLAGLLAVLPLMRSTSFESVGHSGILPASNSTAQDNPPPASPSGGAATVNGLDFSGLTPAQVAIATEILNATRCNCSCGMTLSECRTKDPTCTRSLTLAKGVLQDLKSGKDRATVQSNLTATLARLATPPPAAPARPAEDPNKVFKIDTTGAPYKGAKGASVVIVEFSDYQ
jgi:hypothetical protein